jgi:hypothetical protein
MSFYPNIALSLYRNIARQNRLSDEGLSHKVRTLISHTVHALRQ